VRASSLFRLHSRWQICQLLELDGCFLFFFYTNEQNSLQIRRSGAVEELEMWGALDKWEPEFGIPAAWRCIIKRWSCHFVKLTWRGGNENCLAGLPQPSMMPPGFRSKVILCGRKSVGCRSLEVASGVEEGGVKG
jgi:hypothetical protein